MVRALVSRPTVVFADEPTGNLDSAAGAEILGLLRSSVDAYGQTMLMVTHDANAAAIADRVLSLADGKVVRDDSPTPRDDVIGYEAARLAGRRQEPLVAPRPHAR